MSAAGEPIRFPFEAAMALGFSLLRLSPDAFWSLSPREFFAALRGMQGGAGLIAPPARATLDALMARYPDTPPMFPR